MMTILDLSQVVTCRFNLFLVGTNLERAHGRVKLSKVSEKLFYILKLSGCNYSRRKLSGEDYVKSINKF